MFQRRSALVLCLASIAWLASAPCRAADPQHAEAERNVVHDGATDGAEHLAVAKQAPPSPLSFDPDLAGWTFVVFLLLLAVLWKFAWGPISQALDLREKKIADNIAAAEQCNLDAKRLLADYEAQLAAAHDKIRGMMEEARRDAELAGQAIKAEASASAAADLQRGKHEIETATAQALKSLAETSANLAVDLAGRIVSAKLNAADHANLITQALANFPKGGAGHN